MNAAVVAALALVPLVLLMLTSFVKLSVVLSLLRNAIGAPDAPSGLVVMGVSLILTAFVMAPVAIDMLHAATHAPAGAPAPTPPGPTSPPTPAPRPPAPGQAPSPAASASVPAPSAVSPPGTSPASATSPSAGGATTSGAAAPAPGALAPAADGRVLDFDAAVRELVPDAYRPQVDAAERALVPLQAFLAKHAGDADRATFTDLAHRMGRSARGDELWVLAPAFLASELREAFAIAVLLFLPFLVIDIVVGLGLAALGLQATSPQTVALPLKLLLFVSVDGWRMLLEALLKGYA